MAKYEAPANMEEKIKKLSRRLNELCGPFYDKATKAQKDEYFKMRDDLDEAMIAYRAYELPLDSQLIDVVETIPASEGNQELKYKTKALSTDQSVMDKARALFVFINIPQEGKCNEC